MTDSVNETELLRAKLNGETSCLPWRELQRFFAGGNMIVVQDGLDLVEVALHIAQDDKDAVRTWLQAGSLVHANEEHARVWTEEDASLWAVVVKPFVLVQRNKEPSGRA